MKFFFLFSGVNDTVENVALANIFAKSKLFLKNTLEYQSGVQMD